MSVEFLVVLAPADRKGKASVWFGLGGERVGQLGLPGRFPHTIDSV